MSNDGKQTNFKFNYIFVSYYNALEYQNMDMGENYKDNVKKNNL